ncbi:MAG TPA: malto-oligosyltrehalose synthase [Chloroflexota bacterium]|nr:malto-oligosyltrehalose synthase [Chloroflexota bacterium]
MKEAILRVPTATYRLQFHAGFPLADATALVPYLAALGVGALYASPLFAARPGSMHGYDVTDPAQINPELGGQAAFDALAAALRAHGLGLLLDIVPNHMAASPDNPWWYDVLQLGRHSPYATFFDIDWRPGPAGLHERVLLPILGAPLRRVLRRGELRLVLDVSGLGLRYYDWRLPLGPRSLRTLLRPAVWHGLARALAAAGAEPADARQLAALCATLPDDDRERLAALQAGLGRLYTTAPAARRYLDARLATWNGRPGAPRTLLPLQRVLAQQAYRLAYWRLAGRLLNYRRFFDIADLVALRIERASVFEAVHALLGRLVAANQVTGLRIDHIDGLYDPLGYLQRLQRWLAAHAPATASATAERAPDPAGAVDMTTSAAASLPGYVVVEKILTGDEPLPDAWPVAGTTGYDFAALVTNLLVDAAGLRALERVYAAAAPGAPADYAAVARQQKLHVMDTLFAGERRALARQLARLAHGAGRGIPQAALEHAISLLTAHLPVYRTYTRGDTVAARDRAYLAQALAAASEEPAGDRRALAFLRDVLLLAYPPALPIPQRRAWRRWVMRWQQFSGPVTAKGLEDSAFYRYHRLIALNEVGGEPDSDGLAPEAFHAAMHQRQARWPHTLNTTSTHDTKRSEDVRARLLVLAELPDAWAARVRRWQAWNAPYKPRVDGQPVPDPNTEYLLYQTLVGAWPLDAAEHAAFLARLQGFALKAAREARAFTSWLHPHTAWEEAQTQFLERLLARSADNPFLADLEAFLRPIAYCGALNALAQQLLKLAAPGVPDLYQGTELWDFSLVDPDNRRPVDFARRRAALEALLAARDLEAMVRELLAAWPDGRVKLWLTHRALRLRREFPTLFAEGAYLPVRVEGARGRHVVAFARRHAASWALAVVPRLPARLLGVTAEWAPPPALGVPAASWADTCLVLPAEAPRRWRHLFTGQLLDAARATRRATLPLGDVLGLFPAALLVPAAGR